MYICNEILFKIFKDLKINQIYPLRLTCKRFLNISKRINTYSPSKVLKRISIRGSTSEYLLYILNHVANIDFNIILQKFLLLQDHELLLTLFDYYEVNEDKFINHNINFCIRIDYTSYFNNIDCFKIFLKRTNVKLSEQMILSILDISEDHILTLLKNNYIKNIYVLNMCAIKSYSNILDYILNIRLKYRLLDSLDSPIVFKILKIVKNKSFIKHALRRGQYNFMFIIIMYCIRYEDDKILKYFKCVRNIKSIWIPNIEINQEYLKSEMFKSKKSIMISKALKLETLFKDPKKIKNKYLK
jgi:hypothetical protein